MESLLNFIQPQVNGEPKLVPVFVFHLSLAALVLIVIIVMCVLMGFTLNAPANPKGWSTIDYDANQNTRNSLVNYMATQGLSVDSAIMNQFSVATANFGGIFTENISGMRPWIGTVSSDAARLQVEAGARAMVLDIWPDPADRQRPIVAAMVDTDAWSIQRTWKNMGLTKGVGRYSNWQRLTRNVAPAGEIIKAALTAAFSSTPGGQNTDPFFLILRLHGAMTTDYLNHLGDIVRNAIGANSMGTQWNKCVNQKSICTATVNQFLSKAFVIVIPDLQPGYNSLPNINTHAAFTPVFLSTRLGEITNMLEQTPNTIVFDPGSTAAITAATQPNCSNPTGPPQSLAQTGFCVIQPSIGGTTADNNVEFKNVGAQFVAVNLFSPNSDDGVLTEFFDPSNFGVFSFRKI